MNPMTPIQDSCESTGKSQSKSIQDFKASRIVVGAFEKDSERFLVEKARLCCAQEHSTSTLVSTRPTRLTVAQMIVAVCRLRVGQLKDVTCSYYLGKILGFMCTCTKHLDRQTDEDQTQAVHLGS